MRRKSENIASFTAEELEAKAERGEERTDWKRAAVAPLPSGDDPDDAMEEIDWATTELPIPRRKIHASLRIDADVLDWFKAQGRGYQTGISAILRSYYQQHAK
jgi:uncharacterized protein (DUF4415 family)